MPEQHLSGLWRVDHSSVKEIVICQATRRLRLQAPAGRLRKSAPAWYGFLCWSSNNPAQSTTDITA